MTSHVGEGGRRSALLVLLVAIAARSAFVFFPPPGPLFADMQEYHEKALAILERGSYGHATRPPLYPLFLAAVLRLGGSGRAPLAAAQAAMGAAVALLAFGTASRLCGRRAGTAAGLLVACYPGLVVYTGLVMSENLFIFLFAGALFLLARDRPLGPAAGAGAGLLLGLAGLTRSVGAGLAPCAALWLAARGERRGGACLLAAALLTVAPWTARNCIFYGRFVPLDTYGGYNFLFGNNPHANGRQEPALVERLAEEHWREWRTGGKCGAPAEVVVCPEGSAEGYRAGVRFIAAHPRSFLRLGARKLGYLYGPEIRELSWGCSMGWFGNVRRRVLVPAAAAVVAGFPVLALLALGGAAFGKGGARGGWGILWIAILYFTAAHFLTFGESRFHLPLVPVLAVFASRLARPGVRADARRILAFAAIAGLLALNWSARMGEEWGRLKRVLAPGGTAARIGY